MKPLLWGTKNTMSSIPPSMSIIKVPTGTIGIRGTAIYLELDQQQERSSLCNCYGHTVVYGNSGKLLRSLNNTKKDMHSVVNITDETVLTASKFKHEVVGKEFLKN